MKKLTTEQRDAIVYEAKVILSDIDGNMNTMEKLYYEALEKVLNENTEEEHLCCGVPVTYFCDCGANYLCFECGNGQGSSCRCGDVK